MNHTDDIAFNDCLMKNFTHLDDGEAELVRQWRNDISVRRWMYQDHLITPEEHERFLAGLAEDRRNRYWLVVRRGTPVGVVSLNRIDEANGNAYLGIYADPSGMARGNGAVLIACLRYAAFDMLGLHTLKLEVVAENEKAVDFYRKHGFEQEGLLRAFVCKDGRRQDVIVMGILNDRT
jgi:UDP-4-amino-4,6-dideoxy-N-acetyl-beta-L-altrosamine N-acetyltransferase